MGLMTPVAAVCAYLGGSSRGAASPTSHALCLGAGRDELTGMHGNTALALVIGAARRHELTGEEPFPSPRTFSISDGSRRMRRAARRTTSCGGCRGSSGTLLFSAGGARYEHVESCTTHNMMRLVETLPSIGWRRALLRVDGARAVQRGAWHDEGRGAGRLPHFLPLGTASKKALQAWRHAGRSTPYGDFWCCQARASRRLRAWAR